VLVAVSGGHDSTALLVALREEGHSVVAAHYDHALQPESARAAEHVRALSGRLGVDVLIERRTRSMPRGSVQAGARGLRYEFLERARAQAGADVVAIAHTADDVVEGVFAAYFNEGRDVGDPSVLADVGASAGLDRARILAMLASDEGQAEVRSELQRAVNLRVSGVPTVLVDGVPLFSGAIRAELMEAELRKAAGHVRS